MVILKLSDSRSELHDYTYTLNTCEAKLVI